MAQPLIAIVGSADSERIDKYNPPLKNRDQIPKAAQELGRAFAEAGFGIMVYSADPRYIEADVVRGYVDSGRAQPKSIQVRFPVGMRGTDAKFHKEESDLFDPRPDQLGYWQVSFYMSLQEADGILLLGGAESAFITGLVALMNRKPCLALTTFGGSAESVWRVALGGLATREHKFLMARESWMPDSAQRLVNVLTEQLAARKDQEAMQLMADQQSKAKLRQRALVAGGVFLAALALTILGLFGGALPVALFALAFFGTPVFAGGAGGVTRIVLDDLRGAIPSATIQGIILGMMAGVLSAILFVLAQLASNTSALDFSNGVPRGLGPLVPFELIIGFTAGLTLEAVFAKLRRQDVVNATPIAATDRGGGQ